MTPRADLLTVRAPTIPRPDAPALRVSPHRHRSTRDVPQVLSAAEIETVVTAIVNHYCPLSDGASDDECCRFVQAALGLSDADFGKARAKA